MNGEVEGGLLTKPCERCRRRHNRCPLHRGIAPNTGIRILVIPDTQIKPGVPTNHMTWAGKYAVAKRPDVIVHIGDAADMPSLSSYDKGKKSSEMRRYKADVLAAYEGMARFSRELDRAKNYAPKMILTYGNHEDRIDRIGELNSEYDGVFSKDDLRFGELGWECHEFLEVVRVHKIDFSHYFISGAKGLPAASAAVVLRQRMRSAIQGHNQKFDLAVHPYTGHIAMMVGAFYLHHEDYLGRQGQANRLQIVMLNEVRGGGVFDPMLISMNYLKRKYGNA